VLTRVEDREGVAGIVADLVSGLLGQHSSWEEFLCRASSVSAGGVVGWFETLGLGLLIGNLLGLFVVTEDTLG